MKAIVLKGYGGVEQLEQRDIPEPKPGAGEVRVKVAAASVNPIAGQIARLKRRLTTTNTSVRNESLGRRPRERC